MEYRVVCGSWKMGTEVELGVIFDSGEVELGRIVLVCGSTCREAGLVMIFLVVIFVCGSEVGIKEEQRGISRRVGDVR